MFFPQFSPGFAVSRSGTKWCGSVQKTLILLGLAQNPHALGAGGRRFESCCPTNKINGTTVNHFLFCQILVLAAGHALCSCRLGASISVASVFDLITSTQALAFAPLTHAGLQSA